jgi:uncharacterized protein YneF (UPF0154 family)
MADSDRFTEGDSSRENDHTELRRGVGVLAVSWVMALAILGGWLAGWFLDRKVIGNTFPVLTILGVVLGVVGGGWYSYRTIMRGMRR